MHVGTFLKLGLYRTRRRRRRERRRRRRGVGNGEGLYLPQPTSGSGGASWAPPAGSEAEPRPKTNLTHFKRYRTGPVIA